MPVEAAKPRPDPKLRKAKTLFSQKATGSRMATIAMGPVPRDERAARLCATELEQQLLHASPPYYPEIVPFERLKEGTVIESADTVFRASWEWYKLSYRCEIDAAATRVVSFAFDVGKPLTPDEFRARALPSN